MKNLTPAKFQVVSAAVWAVCIVACSFAVNVLKEPDMLLYIMIAGYFATAGLYGRGGQQAQD